MTCFFQLRDNVPSWISDVNQLSAHVHTKRAEFAAEAEKLILSPSSLHRKKSNSSSLSSVRSQRSAKPTGQSLKRNLSRESLENNDGVKKQRTLKNGELSTDQTATAVAPGSTTPVPMSRKAGPTHVISYDGHTQKVLEKMVRDIWTAKSSIRSSRISASMCTAFGGRMKMHIPLKKSYKAGIPDITSDTQANIEVDPDAATATDEDGLEDQLHLRMIMMKQRSRRNQAPYIPPPQLRQHHQPATIPPRTKESPYDFIESQLENAQNLCETAAYKFLREGNCLEELDRILQAYELILEASTTMAKQGEEQTHRENATKLNATTITTDGLEMPVVAVTTTTTTATKDFRDNDPEEMNAAVLEVDDRSDASEVSIDITAFRMTRHGQRTMHPFKINRA